MCAIPLLIYIILIYILPVHDPSIELLAEQIAENQLNQICHEGVHMSPGQSPFRSSKHEAQFFGMLQHAIESNAVPHGYGTLPYEWEGGNYPSTKQILIANRGSRQLEVLLEHPIWLARARLWAQALHALASF